MKIRSTKIAFQKKLALFLALILALCALFSLTAAAEQGGDDSDSKQSTELKEWVMNDDKSVSDGEKTYYPKYEDNNVIIDPMYTYYTFANTVYIPWLECEATVKSYAEDGEIIWLAPEDYDFNFIYMTEKGREYYNGLMSGENIITRLYDADRYLYSDISNELSDKLIAAGKSADNKLEIDVLKLKRLEKYELLVHDAPSETLSNIMGIVYFLDGKAYYLHTAELPNNYFDADGYFSYHSGNIEITELDDETAKEIREALEYARDITPRYVYEETEKYPYVDIGYDDYYDDTETSPFGFWFCFILLGFILPIPFLIIGLVFPTSKRMGYPRYWYILSIIAAVWMLISLALLILIVSI